MLEIHDSQKSLSILSSLLSSNQRVFFTRFGDNDIYMISGKDKHNHPMNNRPMGNNKTVWSLPLQHELLEAIRIDDPCYKKAVSACHRLEPGMAPGILAPFANARELEKRVEKMTIHQDFLLHVLFQYLFCFKKDTLKTFINTFITPFPKLYIGSVQSDQVADILGMVDFYVQTPHHNAYASIDNWFPSVIDILTHHDVKVVIPSAGQASRVVAKRLWNMQFSIHCIDMGSIFDAHANIQSRTWIRKLQASSSLTPPSPVIHTYIAYAPDNSKNLGKAYNDFMLLLPDDQWACFIDHDAMFTTPWWYRQLQAIIKKYPDAGLFTAKTNRVKNIAQLHEGQKSENHDIKYHRTIGKKLFDEFYDKVTPLNTNYLISGVLMLINKSVWKKCPFFESFLGVDYQIHQDILSINKKVYVMEGVYLYHWYRGDGDLTHLNGAPRKRVEKNRDTFNRTKAINALIRKYGYTAYLEIGVRTPPNNFTGVHCLHKESVDPDTESPSLHKISSDQYFNTLPSDKKYDIIFIDGLHTREQVTRDIFHALKHLQINGSIVLHDCNPPTKWHQRSYDEYQNECGVWYGTVWQSFVELRCTRPDLEMFVIDADCGIGIIRRGKQKVLSIPNIFDYQVFASHRKEALHLIPPEKFINMLRK